MRVHGWFEMYWDTTPAITRWHMGAAGVTLFGLMLLTYTLIGDRSKGRKRCPRCWYDMSGATFKPGPSEQGTFATCPECGRAVCKPTDLLRSRRSRARLVTAAVILLLGGCGLAAGARLSTPQRILPTRVLTTWMFRDGDAPRWVRDEFARRTLVDDLNDLTPRLVNRWFLDVIATGSVGSDAQLLEVLTARSYELPYIDDKPTLSLAELESVWSIGALDLAERLASPDLAAHHEAVGMLESFEWLMLSSLANHPERLADDANGWRRPAEVFPPPTYSAKTNAVLATAFTTDPLLIDSVARLMGGHAHTQFREELLAAYKHVPEDSMQYIALCLLLRQAFISSEAGRQDVRDLVRSDSEDEVVYGLRALNAGRIFEELEIDEAFVVELRALAVHPSDRVRRHLWATLTRWGRLDPVTWQVFADRAMTSPMDAELVLQRFYYNDEAQHASAIDRARRLAASPNPAVRLIVARRVGYLTDDIDASRDILRVLREDEDPGVAKAASLRLD